MPVILMLGRLRPEDGEFEASMGYITKKKKKRLPQRSIGFWGSKLMFVRETTSHALARSFLLPPYHIFPDSLEGKS